MMLLDKKKKIFLYVNFKGKKIGFQNIGDGASAPFSQPPLLWIFMLLSSLYFSHSVIAVVVRVSSEVV